MPIQALSFILAFFFAIPVFGGCPGGPISVDFVGMDPPSTPEEKADAYTRARLRMRCGDGSVEEHALSYHRLFATTDRVGNDMVGVLLDAAGKPLRDRDGPMASDGPDGTSLIQIPGLTVPGGVGNPLAMVTQFEYRSLPPNDGESQGSFWSKLPAAVGLTLLDQDPATGLLTAKSYRPVDFSGVGGGWIHCGSTLSAWNTHLGSEEYEPDAKVRGGAPAAEKSDDKTDIASFSRYYFGDPDRANPYHYGLVPEVEVSADGAASVVKHYAPGRYAREMLAVADDGRTAIGGDDGKNTGLFMFVADRPRDLSAGTLYAAKVTQLDDEGGGLYGLEWHRLAHGTNAEIEGWVDAGIRFDDLFEASNRDPKDPGFKRVRTYNGIEWLRLRSSNRLGMTAGDIARAAAFLETRRLAAYLGATTEFSKMEYVAYNPTEKSFYLTISRVEAGMADEGGDVHIGENEAGMVLEMLTAPGRSDRSGDPIDSPRAGIALWAVPGLIGEMLPDGDAEGNRCRQDRICGPDNLVYVDSIRTLFVGEDTGARNNNYLWAYHIDTGELSRILSVPMGAEVTGLMVAGDYNGHAYITGNFQHPGDKELRGYRGGDRDAIRRLIDEKWGNRKRAAIGYIGTSTGALPPFK
jgi:secreted PhoX family phosphatase